MRYISAAKSDVGRKRQGNEDSFCLEPGLGLFVVADGMGGHAAGEVASRLAVDTIREYIAKHLLGEELPNVGPAASGESDGAVLLLGSIRRANQVIYETAQCRSEYAGMGTTVAAALTRGSTVVLAHVGDSRIYRIRADRIAQVSRDHSFVQQQVDRGVLSVEDSYTSRYRHMITRALGLKEAVDVDLSEEPAEAEDILLLCSDGLSDLLEDEEILATVRENTSDLDQACQALVDLANFKGGDDNITAILIRARAREGASRPVERGSGRTKSPSGKSARAGEGREGALGWLKRTFIG